MSQVVRDTATGATPQGEICIRTIAMPADTNHQGDIFGGWLMGQMDLAGGNLAMRRAQGRVATVAVEGMTFISPVAVGDEITIYASILSVGRTSMRIAIEAWRRLRHSDEISKVTSGIFVFVAIDEQRRPCPLPAL